jgi:hypothetical protein
VGAAARGDRLARAARGEERREEDARLVEYAVERRGELVAVYVLGAKRQPLLRQVRTGETFADGSVEVLAGLTPGERIFANPIAAGMLVAAADAR